MTDNKLRAEAEQWFYDTSDNAADHNADFLCWIYNHNQMEDYIRSLVGFARSQRNAGMRDAIAWLRSTEGIIGKRYADMIESEMEK